MSSANRPENSTVLADEPMGADVAEVASEFDRMLAGYRKRFDWDALYESNHEEFWAALAQGGWLDVRPDTAGMATTLALAETWGRHLVPLPFLSSLVRTDEQNGDPLVRIALAARAADGVWLVPFGDEAGACIPTRSGGLAEIGVKAESTDRFAPSLPLARFSAEQLPDVLECPLTVLLPHVIAEALGAAAVCFDKAVAHAKNRVAYGRPIGTFQAVKHRIANMYVSLEFARSALSWCAQAADDADARLATATALEQLESVVESSIQVHGGMACTWEYGLHFYARHLFTLAKLAGV